MEPYQVDLEKNAVYGRKYAGEGGEIVASWIVQVNKECVLAPGLVARMAGDIVASLLEEAKRG